MYITKNIGYRLRLPWCSGRTLDYRVELNKPMRVQACGTEAPFLFAFETNGNNFESTVVFLKNSKVKLKYIFEYLCWYYNYESNVGVFITSKLVSVHFTKILKYKIEGKYNVMCLHMKK